MNRLLLVLFALFAPSLPAQQIVRGFTSSSTPRQLALERKLRTIPEPGRIRKYMKRMADEPHHAGSAGSKAVAHYALGLLREWGLDAKIETFETLLPYPTTQLVEMTAPVLYRANLREPVLTEDKDSADANQLPAFNAYSASGDVTAPLVYVNFGIAEDYEQLRRMGIDVKGKIVLARYGKGWRGTKPRLAQERGAVGCIIYSDPKEDGFYQGDVYPAGRFRPPGGVQRGSVMDMPLHVGDPLTPGWASVAGARRLAREDARTIMKIPVIPLSSRDAAHLMRQLGGPVAPEGWRGAMSVTYHVGPGPATVHLKLDFDWAIRPIHNVIATIKGSVYPDQWVIYGNHHDAWVNGASDPVSGASALLESARALAEMRKTGWQPKRTIKLALWDGEEFGLIGSTEWVEKHRVSLAAKAVAYINSDSTGKGLLSADGSPFLDSFFSQVLREIPSPAGRGTLFESARGTARDDHFHLGSLGAGSDYVPFLDHAGISSLNLGFGGEASGIYHSTYDSIEWYKRFSDGDFTYSRTLSALTATMLTRLADADLLPFEFKRLAHAVGTYADELARLPGGGKLDLQELRAELSRLASAAKAYEIEYQAALARGARGSPETLGPLNQAIFQTERALTLESGLPGRPWYKHQIYAPGVHTGYSAKTLPAVREAAEAGQWMEANRQAREVARVLRELGARLVSLTRQLRTL
ncbi:MAG: M28 family metallopeptidase [Bryobacteraceae bacterium]|nr:M28 family metallopeptidase [Bryobacteraceae bacterium]